VESSSAGTSEFPSDHLPRQIARLPALGNHGRSQEAVYVFFAIEGAVQTALRVRNVGVVTAHRCGEAHGGKFGGKSGGVMYGRR
jgi:hypothetical protein